MIRLTKKETENLRLLLTSLLCAKDARGYGDDWRHIRSCPAATYYISSCSTECAAANHLLNKIGGRTEKRVSIDEPYSASSLETYG